MTLTWPKGEQRANGFLLTCAAAHSEHPLGGQVGGSHAPLDPSACSAAEPIAAALSYGFGSPVVPIDTLLVYDLGGGTLDLTIVEAFDGIMEVRHDTAHTHGRTRTCIHGRGCCVTLRFLSFRIHCRAGPGHVGR